MRKRINPHLAKIHRSYTVEEAASILSIHKNTVRIWVKNGLQTCDDKRPMLILGRHLRDYLQRRKVKNKRPCPPGKLYCVRCKEPQSPLGNQVEYQPVTRTKGNLMGICPNCDATIFRLASVANLKQLRPYLDISMPQGESHICDNS